MRGVVGWRGGGAYRLPGLAGTLYSRGRGGKGRWKGREGTVRVEGRGRERIGVEERREGRRGGKRERREERERRGSRIVIR